MLAVLWMVWMERNKPIFEVYSGLAVKRWDHIWERVRLWVSLLVSVSGEFRNYLIYYYVRLDSIRSRRPFLGCYLVLSSVDSLSTLLYYAFLQFSIEAVSVHILNRRPWRLEAVGWLGLAGIVDVVMFALLPGGRGEKTNASVTTIPFRQLRKC